PLGKDAGKLADGIDLPRVRRAALERGLRTMGVSEGRARDLAAIGRRSLLALRRQMARVPEVATPPWSTAENVHALLPAVLAGTWNEAYSGDKDAIAALSGRPYDQVARDMAKWSAQSDSPIRVVGLTWILASKEDAWSLVTGRVQQE